MDRQTEKANNVISTYLKAFAARDPLNWDAALPMAEFAYNTSLYIGLKMSPFKMDLRYYPSMLLDIILNIAQTTISACTKEGADFTTHLAATLNHTQDALQETKDQQTAQANKTY